VFGWLLLAFTVVPLVELYLLLQVGKFLGVVPTVGLVLVTGALGAALARREGMRVVRGWQAALRSGESPSEGVISGVLILVAGVLMVTPGVLTDVLGVTLLVPPSRRWVALRLADAVDRRIADGRITVVRMQGPFDGPGDRPRVIDVPGKVVDPPPSPADPGSRRRPDEPHK
jgi:UPF0716 protein FxsA